MQKKILSILVVLLSLVVSKSSYSQAIANKTSWQHTHLFSQKVFIENKGQFDKENKKIKFGLKDEGVEMFFSPDGLIYKHQQIERLSERESEKILEKRGEKENNEAENESQSREKVFTKTIDQYLHLQWMGANSNPEIITEEKQNDYYCYANANKNLVNTTIKSSAYKKIIYKNLYNGIDVVYTFPEGKEGIKYAFIVHPGADVSQIKMKYNDAKSISFDDKNNIVIQSSYGKVIDHAPQTNYQSGNAIDSKFILENNIVSFELTNYDKTQTIIIDPWTVNPAFTSQNKAYDIEKDGVGNIYVFGGSNPYLLKKFTSSGVLIWTYTTVYTGWYGDLGVDPIGNAYISEGYNAANSNPNFGKVDPNGNLIFNVTGPSAVEYWCLNFNCDYTQLSVSGGVGGGNMSNMDLSTGLPLGTVSVSSGEPRGMSKAPNGNFYCLTATSAELIAISPAFTVLYNVPSGYSLAYSIPTLNTGYTTSDAGFNCITTDNNFVYTTDGQTLKKFNIGTGAVVASSAIVGGSATGNAGLILDNCGNVYVGTGNSVNKYDNNLVFQTSAVAPAAVYGISLGPVVGEIIACGDGFISAVNLSACPSALTLTTTSTPSGCGVLGTATVAVSGGTGPYSYLWTPTGQTTATATGLNPGFYTVLVTDAVSCIPYTDTVTVFGGGTGTVVVAPLAATICIGTSVSLTASGSSTYVWSPATGLSSTTGATVTASPAVTTTYTVTGTSGVCIADTTVTVTVVPTLTVTTTPSSAIICAGSSASITANGATTYAWLPATGLSATTGATVTASPLVTTTYTVTGTSGTCTDDTTITITVNPSPVVSVIPIAPSVLCPGDNVNLTASGATTYSWLPATYLSATTGATVTSSPFLATTYTITGTTAGCTDTATVTVTINSNLVVSVTPLTSVICPGGSTLLTASGAITYAWLPAAGLSATTGASVTATPAVTTTYTVTGTTTSCFDTATSIITVAPPTAANAGLNDTICEGESVMLNGSGGTDYTWLPITGLSNPNIANPLASPTITTSYTLTVSNGGFCASTDAVNIMVYQPPLANAGQDVTILVGENTILTGSGTGTLVWASGSGTMSCTLCPNPLVAPTQTTPYYITVTGANGCISTDTVLVNVNTDYGIYIPNAFTPNGDNTNTLFMAQGFGIANIEMSIYNRWGEKLFYTKENNKGWDGTYAGKVVEETVYVYVITATPIKGSAFKRMGHVNVVR